METSADEAQRRDEPEEPAQARPGETGPEKGGTEQDPPADDDYFVPV